jgi:hypothetical protein
MRFVRNAAIPEWGLGVVASEAPKTLDVLFEGGGHRNISRSSPHLIEVSDSDVPKEHRLRRREDWPKVESDAKRATAKQDLPKRFDALVKEFFAFFPTGLHSPECDREERDYKVDASVHARKELNPGALDELLAAGNHTEVLHRVRRSISKVNLVYPNELMKFGDIPTTSHPEVARRLVTLVRAGKDTPTALEALAEALAPHGAAKWTIVSLIPFLLAPEEWPFVKPTFIERGVKATGIDVEYQPTPNARTYSLIRELYEVVAINLGRKGFAPRDFIDVQTFLWVASGMKREAIEQRERKSPEGLDE